MPDVDESVPPCNFIVCPKVVAPSACTVLTKLTVVAVLSVPEPVVIVKLPPVPEFEADNTKRLAENVACDADTLKSPATVAALIASLRLVTADPV